jgi:hypothetical protein
MTPVATKDSERNGPIVSTRRLTTSSSDLKGDKGPKNGKGDQSPSKQYPTDSVVSRLSRAAARARVAAEAKEKRGPSKGFTDDDGQDDRKKPLGNLSQLTKAIDQQLDFVEKRKNLVADSYSALRPAGDSMSAVMSHNFKQQPPAVSVKNKRHVAIVLAKPLIQDQVTMEYANRMRRLVNAMQTEDYRPDVVAFVGGFASDGYLAGADAGYLFFRHLCTSQQVCLDNISFHLERTYIRQGALQNLVHQIQQAYVPGWREAIQNDYTIAPAFDYMSGPIKRPSKLQIHFSFVSSEYHLCQLHAIHLRSPGQSKLEALENLDGRVESSWSYLYATTHRIASSDPALIFCGKAYQTVQELVPVLLNLRGVVDDQEFFQRDNYRVLVAARRILVTDMEGLYSHQASLQAVHQLLSGDEKPLDVIMESALLSLGRCLDVVRPAGLLTESVPAGDWKLALSMLEYTVHQISQACDPDQPLKSGEWGSMGVYEEMMERVLDEPADLSGSEEQ